MDAKNLVLGLMIATGAAACSRTSEKNQAQSVNEKQFKILDTGFVGVRVEDDPTADFLGFYDTKRSVYSLTDSSVVTSYGNGDNLIGGQKRFWRNGEFDQAEKVEFTQATNYYKLKMGQ